MAYEAAVQALVDRYKAQNPLFDAQSMATYAISGNGIVPPEGYELNLCAAHACYTRDSGFIVRLIAARRNTGPCHDCREYDDWLHLQGCYDAEDRMYERPG